VKANLYEPARMNLPYHNRRPGIGSRLNGAEAFRTGARGSATRRTALSSRSGSRPSRTNKVVHPDVVREAVRRCSEGDYTFSILTDKNGGIGGEIRSVELHPWVTKTGQFGLMPLKRPIAGNSLSEMAYDNKVNKLAENQGKWVRRTTIEKDLVVIPLPPNADGFGEPRWPKVLTDGDWETIIRRAFDNRWIRSLEDKVARNLAGLE